MKKTLLITLALGIIMPSVAGAMLSKERKNKFEIMKLEYQNLNNQLKIHGLEIQNKIIPDTTTTEIQFRKFHKKTKKELKIEKQIVENELKEIEQLEAAFQNRKMNILEMAKKDANVKKIIQQKEQLLKEKKQIIHHLNEIGDKPQLKTVIKKQKKSKFKKTIFYCALGSVVVSAVASTMSLIWYLWKRKTK